MDHLNSTRYPRPSVRFKTVRARPRERDPGPLRSPGLFASDLSLEVFGRLSRGLPVRDDEMHDIGRFRGPHDGQAVVVGQGL